MSNDWKVPKRSIADQARERGEGVPVGEIARRLRSRGYELPDRVHDLQVVWHAAESPTGYRWAWRKKEISLLTSGGDVDAERCRASGLLAWDSALYNWVRVEFVFDDEDCLMFCRGLGGSYSIPDSELLCEIGRRIAAGLDVGRLVMLGAAAEVEFEVGGVPSPRDRVAIVMPKGHRIGRTTWAI